MSFVSNNPRLEKLARGKCSAISRPASLGVGIRWFPTVADEEYIDFDVPDEGFEAKSDAIAAAKRAREAVQEILAEAMGAN